MGSTEDGAWAGLPVLPLKLADLPAALALSASAHWNQNEADWRMMLTLGQAWCIRARGADGHEQLAASILILPYGGEFAWVSMVLVLPPFRRRGLATRLLRHAFDVLAAKELGAVLDATPEGRSVYAQQGFADTWGFMRFRREARVSSPASAVQASGATTRPLCESDWPAIAAFDTLAFGADRSALLRQLARRLPQAARVAEQEGRLRGFVFGRDGREACHLGPLLADDMGIATKLLEGALHDLPGPVYLDLLDSRAALRPWLQQQGFFSQRPFMRMVRGRTGAPGRPDTIVLVAGPELG